MAEKEKINVKFFFNNSVFASWNLSILVVYTFKIFLFGIVNA